MTIRDEPRRAETRVHRVLLPSAADAVHVVPCALRNSEPGHVYIAIDCDCGRLRDAVLFAFAHVHVWRSLRRERREPEPGGRY